MFTIKALILFCFAGVAYFHASVLDYDQNQVRLNEKRETTRFVSSCPFFSQFKQLSNVYDEYHNYVELSRARGGQWFYIAQCQNTSGPPTCRTCCHGVNPLTYHSICQPILTMQVVRICVSANCTKTRNGWGYIGASCSCNSTRYVNQLPEEMTTSRCDRSFLSHRRLLHTQTDVRKFCTNQFVQ